MNITYDKDVDAAYITIGAAVEEGQVHSTVVCEEKDAEGIHLDFDKKGRLLGIEILGASRLISAETLADAQ